MSESPQQDDELAGTEQPFVQHLMELRDRLVRALIAVGVVALALAFYPGAGELYDLLAAPLVAYLLSDVAKDVNGQIFASRMNEIFLMGQSRPLRSVHRDGGWTCETLAEHGMPALKGSFYKLDRSADVFSWDAV